MIEGNTNCNANSLQVVMPNYRFEPWTDLQSQALDHFAKLKAAPAEIN